MSPPTRRGGIYRLHERELRTPWESVTSIHHLQVPPCRTEPWLRVGMGAVAATCSPGPGNQDRHLTLVGQQLCPVCPAQGTPPPRAGNDPRRLPWWVAYVALFKAEVLLVQSLGKRVCSAIPHITLCVMVGIPLPKEASFLPCLSDLGRGS